jgi:4'-phosphopantetheinyl transferase
MNVLIVSTQLNSIVPDTFKARVQNFLPSFFVESLAKKKVPSSKTASFLGMCLLGICLEEFGLSLSLLQSLIQDEFGKPHFNTGYYDFNISHSGDLVVCAFVEKSRIGIDIEQIKQFNFHEVTGSLSLSHREIIANAKDPLIEFYSVWTKCESILKAEGVGLAVSPSEITFLSRYGILGTNRWYNVPLNIADGYSCTLASSENNCNINYLKPFA